VATGPLPSSGSLIREEVLTNDSPSLSASSLSALASASYAAETRKVEVWASRFQNMTYVAPEARAASSSSLGIVCASASSSPRHSTSSLERPYDSPYSITPPTTGTYATAPMR